MHKQGINAPGPIIFDMETMKEGILHDNRCKLFKSNDLINLEYVEIIPFIFHLI